MQSLAKYDRLRVQDYLAGETLHSLGRRHDLSRDLIRIWIQKFEAGTFDDEATAADTIQTYEARPPWSGSSEGRLWRSSF